MGSQGVTGSDKGLEGVTTDYRVYKRLKKLFF